MKAFTREQSIDLFSAKFSKGDGCWEWTASRNRNGYGNFRSRTFFPGELLAHRISWLIHKGDIPAGLQVLHNCDNPCCVRPDHLFLGTMVDNMKDMAAKGRHATKRGTEHLPRGAAHHYAQRGPKITRQQACDIRASRASNKALSDFLEVDRSLISKIRTGRIWK